MSLMKTFLASLLLSIVLGNPGTVFAAGSSWTLQEQEGAVRVYTREVEQSPYLAVKATVLINAPLNRVRDYLGDGNGCAKWRAMCKSSEVIETISDNERYVYLVLDLPWPAKDRDMVMHSTTSVDPNTFTATVDLKSDSTRKPPGDYVRAESTGQFIIRALGKEQVEFTYIMHTDLGGGLPAGSVNSRLTESALADLERLQALAEKGGS